MLSRLLVAGAALLGAIGAVEVPLEYAPAGALARHRQATKRKAGGAGRRQAQSRTLEVEEDLSHVYYLTLMIGTPPRPFRLHLDTGSSTLVIPATYADCPTCDPHFDRGFDESGSSTASALSCDDPACGACSTGCGQPSFTDPTYAFLNGHNQCRETENLVGNNECRFASDSECDDGSRGGSGRIYCRAGQDCDDCANCHKSCCWHGQDACASKPLVYGDGSGVSGKVVQDKISLGGTGDTALAASAYFYSFDKVHGMDNGGSFETANLDGIIGVAGDGLDDSPGLPVLDAILGAGKLDNVFALCLQGHAGSHSALDVGSIDPSKYVGKMKYVPFVHGESEHYMFKFYSVDAPFRTQVGDDELHLTPRDYEPSQDPQISPRVVVDSGTNGIALPSHVMYALMQAVSQGASAEARRSGKVGDLIDQRCFAVESLDYNPNKDFPLVSFWLRDVDGKGLRLDLAAQQYMRFVPGRNPEHPYVWCSQFRDSDQEQAIFGAPFLEAYYTAFDRGNFVLGFAPPSQKCGNHLQGPTTWQISGCTDPAFVEYDSAASVEDESACVTRNVNGCLSPNYAEYNPAATTDTSPTSCCTCKRKIVILSRFARCPSR